MATSRISKQEQKDIERDVKRLIVKFIQVVLQSRNGSKANYPSKMFSSSTDWFCLSIPDLPEISSEIKNAFERQPVDIRQPVCIEISLKTTEDETLILEYWWLVNTGKATQIRPSFYKASSPVSNYIGTLLRSLLLVTRSTPAYRLARNQSSGGYCIHHKISFDEPEFYPDDEFKKHMVAMVPSPMGDMNLFVAYKTKLLMCPRKTTDLAAEIKDDYFNVEVIPTAPKKTANDVCHQMEESEDPDDPQDAARDHDLTMKMKNAAFAPVLMTEISSEKTEDVPFASLLQFAKMSPINSRRKRHESLDDTDRQNMKNDDGIEIVVEQTMQQSCDSVQSLSFAKDTVVVKDDFVMVDLKPPFAGMEEDLSQLFQKMIDIPSLSIFEEPVSYSETVSYLEDQLAHFEAMGMEFNNFVLSIQTPDF